jgi:hypothetical protein
MSLQDADEVHNDAWRLCGWLEVWRLSVYRVDDVISNHIRYTNKIQFSVALQVSVHLTFNPWNAELNPICHLLVLLGDLTFMGPCIVSLFQYISNKMQRYTIYLYLEIALHVSGGTSTHHQERIQPHLQHLVFVTPLLLSAAIVGELEPVWVCCGRLKPNAPAHKLSANLYDINHCCMYSSKLLMMDTGTVRNM